MSAGKRRQPPTLLDWLESEGYASEKLARILRYLWPTMLKKGEVITLTQENSQRILLHLLYMLMLPARPAARAAAEKSLKISFEHAYYVLRGDSAATKRTADKFKVSRRTVSNACKRFPIQFERNNKRRPEIRKAMDLFHQQTHQVGNKLH